jgi:hypothetical protein
LAGEIVLVGASRENLAFWGVDSENLAYVVYDIHMLQVDLARMEFKITPVKKEPQHREAIERPKKRLRRPALC